MACDVCRNLNCHGGEYHVNHSFLIVPLPRLYESCLYVPCYFRKQVLSLICLWKEEAFEDGFEEEDINLVFGTNDELSYKIKFTDGTHRPKFHGPGWEKLICDYDLCYGDIIKLDLQGDDFFFHIDMMFSESRGSRKAVPKPSIALEGLNLSQRSHIDKTVYTWGIKLSYNDMACMLKLVLNAKDNHAITFVHCLSFTNIHKDRLKIPAVVTDDLRVKVGYLPLRGSIRLVQIFIPVDLPGTYCIHKDGRMAISGFSAFADAARLTLDWVVLITIQKRIVGDKELLSLVITGLYNKTA